MFGRVFDAFARVGGPQVALAVPIVHEGAALPGIQAAQLLALPQRLHLPERAADAAVADASCPEVAAGGTLELLPGGSPRAAAPPPPLASLRGDGVSRALGHMRVQIAQRRRPRVARVHA